MSLSLEQDIRLQADLRVAEYIHQYRKQQAKMALTFMKLLNRTVHDATMNGSPTVIIKVPNSLTPHLLDQIIAIIEADGWNVDIRHGYMQLY